jgi:hypothetical protein
MIDRPDIALEQRERRDVRLSSPSAGRNKAVIAAALAGILPPSSRVLEIASGTGEHGLACVMERPDLSWTPSEPDPESRASVDAWALESEGRISPCLDLDMLSPQWGEGIESFDALFCANMIHISPWQAAEGLFSGAQTVVSEGGLVCLYGPFLDGERTAPSNLDFDASLKSRDPSWGVRALEDVDALALRHGFERTARHDMPANNLLLVYRKGCA